ncbi:MAG: hypothetical protein ACNS60_08875 [Candidatus Cyclobacteriaceae bacterium M2_1C_046]
MSQQKITTDHNKIKNWAEEHNGMPTVVKNTEKGPGAGLLRIHFEDSQDQDLKKVSWDDFFDTFEKKNLAFLYQDEKESTFHKFIDRED